MIAAVMGTACPRPDEQANDLLAAVIAVGTNASTGDAQMLLSYSDANSAAPAVTIRGNCLESL